MDPLFIADVSDFQEIDWHAYKTSPRFGGISKVSEGKTFTAESFRRNREGMAGLIFRGLYHFGLQANDPGGDADHFCDLVGSLQPGEVPILDAEHTASKKVAHIPGPDAQWCLAFADVVTRRLGAKPALYFSEDYFSSRLGSNPRLAGAFTFFWVAAYRKGPRPTIAGMQLWQSTNGTIGRVRDVPGVKGKRCDDSEFEGTIAELAALAGVPGPGIVDPNLPPKEDDGMRLVGVSNRGIFLVSGSFDSTTGKAVARQVDTPDHVVELVKTGVVTEFNKDTLSDTVFDRYFVVM